LKNKKKILLVVPSNDGTIAFVSHNLYEAFLKAPNVEIKVALIYKFSDKDLSALGKEFSFEDSYSFSGAKVSGLNKQLSFFRMIFWLRKIKKEFKPDMTISTLNSCSTINVLAGGKDYKIGLFQSPHFQSKVLGFLIHCQNILSYIFFFPFLDSLFCISQEVYNSILKSFPLIDKKKVEVVYSVHNVSLITKLASEDLDEFEMNYFKGNVILYCGKLESNKAPDRLVKSFGMNIDLFPKDTHLIFIGEDQNYYEKTKNYWTIIQPLLEYYKISDRVHYWGMKSNIYKYMSRAKVVVSSSYSEGLPGVHIESLIIGTPVVSTNSSQGVWEILSCNDKYNRNLDGIFVADNGIISSNLSFTDITKYDVDIENMANAIEYILNDKLGNKVFLFKEKILAKNVVKKYLEKIQ